VSQREYQNTDKPIIPMMMSNKTIDRINLSCLVVFKSMGTEWIEVGIPAGGRVS
jgi:hypothetical protein